MCSWFWKKRKASRLFWRLSFSDMKETHKIFCKRTAPFRVRCVSSQTFAKRAGSGGLLCDLCTPGTQESPEEGGSQDWGEGWEQTRDGPDGVPEAGRGGRARHGTVGAALPGKAPLPELLDQDPGRVALEGTRAPQRCKPFPKHGAHPGHTDHVTLRGLYVRRAHSPGLTGSHCPGDLLNIPK